MTRVAPVVPGETDLLCEGCGYTLTGLPEGANCPECGRPVESSVGHSRSPPSWEIDPPTAGRFVAFLSTTATVTFRPSHFYRTTTVRGDVARARQFAWIHWAIASVLFAAAAWIHSMLFWSVGIKATLFNLVSGISGMLMLTLMVFATLAGVTWLAARLTTWEATYRGIRLPVGVVLRGMYYHAAHYLPVALLAFDTVAGYRLLEWVKITDLRTGTTYLYILCAEVIVCAAYLFHTYWIAMRNMMYANR